MGISNYVFTSDTEKLRRHLNSERAVLSKRPVELDSDNVRGEDIYSAFVAQHKADAYLLYHVTSPFVATYYFEQAIQALEDGHDSAYSVLEHKTFACYKDTALNWSAPKLPRTQDLEPVYTMTSGFFAFTRETFVRWGSRIGKNPKMIVVDQKAAIDIDYQEDFLLATALLNVPIALKEQL